MIGKWLEIMKEVIPGVRRMTLMFNPETAPYYPVFLRESLQAAHHSQRRFPSRRCATKRRLKRPQQHSRASQGVA